MRRSWRPRAGREGSRPGWRPRCSCGTGGRVFAKAISAALTPGGPSIYRSEAAVAAALPEGTPAPRLLWSQDDGEWVVLVFEHVVGRPPSMSQPDELARVLDALDRLATHLTPSPIAAPRLAVDWQDTLCGWRTMSGDGPPAGLDGYGADVAAAVDRLADLEAGWGAAADGTSLVHGDLRADNMLLTADGVVIVDWPNAAIGASWFDLVAMLPSVAMAGVSPDEIVRRHRLTRDLPEATVDAVVAALAGYFVDRSLQPPPPGLPTVRAFQRAQGVAAMDWLRRRRPDVFDGA